MKKKIVLFSLATLAIVVSLTFSATNLSKSDSNLSSLIAKNVANAEGLVAACFYTGSWSDNCSWAGNTIVRCTSSSTFSCGY